MRDGRDSWLVNWVLGKMEEVVVAAKFLRDSDSELLDAETEVRGSGSPRSGVGQQPSRHTRLASFLWDFCISLSCIFPPTVFWFLFIMPSADSFFPWFADGEEEEDDDDTLKQC